MKRLIIMPAVVAVLLFGAGAAQAQTEALGSTDFETSGAPEAQPAFLRGLLLLHSFEYEDAAEAFREAERLDPGFAMAYWGEAMTYNHPLWAQQDRDAARAALARLAPTPEARATKAPTAREKAYLRAVEILYGAGDKRDRDHAYAEAMRRLHEAYPDDLDAAAFYALAILGTSHDGRDFRTYMRAAAVAEEVFARNPDHPGAAHYLIHSFDDPIHAPLGLRAARAYSKIAPAAAHALHMPSHIFLALGMWDDVTAMNEASWDAAYARAERKHLPVDARNYHALWWLDYGYLQQGRYEDARRTLARMKEDTETSGSRRTRTHLARMRAHHLVEMRAWDGEEAALVVDVSGLGMSTVAGDRFATGMSAVGRGDLAAARAALDGMRAAREDRPETDAYDRGAHAADVMTLELEALIRQAEGRTDEALALMDRATAEEDAMPFDFGPPDVVKPSHELYGEMLLAADRPEAARAQFEVSLDRTPGRALSLLGLARAAEATADAEAAERAWNDLAKVWHRADDGVLERASARRPEPVGDR